MDSRTGGVGLTLTAASHVLFVEHDYNPQTDRQAEDRVHRRGQTRPVVITRLYTRDSIDVRTNSQWS